MVNKRLWKKFFWHNIFLVKKFLWKFLVVHKSFLVKENICWVNVFWWKQFLLYYNIFVKYEILLLYSSKVNFFTKSPDWPTTRLLELLGAAKKHNKLVGPCSIPSLNFWGPGFWINSKGVISHPNVDWPCKDFTQGSARKQPNFQCAFNHYAKSIQPSHQNHWAWIQCQETCLS